ncbi:MAG: rod-binding protein [Proteobacteria bacterium]|nr:rod-binding protein [Pseudomonadota bacterium]
MNPIASNPNFAAEIQRAKSAGLLPKGTPVNRKAWETAQGLEANFFQTMVGSMFEGVKGEGAMGTEATGQDTWRGMLIEEYGKSITAKGGIGLTPAIYREMLRHQESSSHAVQPPRN